MVLVFAEPQKQKVFEQFEIGAGRGEFARIYRSEIPTRSCHIQLSDNGWE